MFVKIVQVLAILVWRCDVMKTAITLEIDVVYIIDG